MAFELNITAEDIDQIVKDSIMKAGFGKAVEAGITKALSGYDSPIEKQLKSLVSEVARTLIEEKYMASIKLAVAKAVEEKITPDLIDKTVSAAMSKMVDAADRY
jgi:flagellar biosynthesis/type III secretory pathway protein FliH